MKRKYLDASIIVAYVLGAKHDKYQFAKACEIFSDIERGRFTGIISTLTLIELVGVFRKTVGRNKSEMLTIDESRQNEHVKMKANIMYKDTFERLMRMNYMKFEEGRSTNFQSVLDDGLDLIEASNGTQKFNPRCSVCNREFKDSSTFIQILAADVFHALLARDIGCDELLTFDVGYMGIESLEQIDPLLINVK